MSAKRICVIGLGQFGRESATRLAQENCEVLAIDLNQKVVNDIADYVHRALRMDARSFDDLSSVVTKEFDEAIVSMGENLEASILAVLHLRKIGVPNIHAKALNNDHASILRALGATNIVFPEAEAAMRLVRHVVQPNVLESINLSEGYLLSEIATPDSFGGKTLSQLNLRHDYGVYVIAAHERLPERTVFLPGPDFKCKPSDSLVLIGKKEDLDRISSLDGVR